MTTPAACYHCSSPVPAGAAWQITLDGVSYPVCCPGCEAVAHAIVRGGLEHYYRQRTEPPAKPATQAVKRDLWAHFDLPERQQWVSLEPSTGKASATLAVEGITCNACAWLIEHRLNALEGVAASAVDLAHHRLRVSWYSETLKPSTLMAELAAIGYSALPSTPDPVQTRLQARMRLTARGLTVATASLAGNAMLTLFPSGGLEENTPGLVAGVSIALSSAAMFAAMPFFCRALGDLKRRQPGLMVPVSLVLVSAYLASVYAVLHGDGHYADAIALLVTLLLLGRYTALRSRLKMLRQWTLPAFATRLEGVTRQASVQEAHERLVRATALLAGDCISVAPGQRLPADGTILQGESSLDTSRLTGEPLPVACRAGDDALCGALNLENPLLLEVSRAGDQTHAGSISTAIRANWQARCPDAADAPYVHVWVPCLLAAAAVTTGLLWGTSQAVDTLVAMLLAGIPLGLSLATPLALGTTLQQLGRRGAWVTRPGALLVLARKAPVTSHPDVVLPGPRAGRLDEVQAMARLAKRCAQQNRRIALGVTLALVGLAASGQLSPLGAVSGSAISVLAVLGNTQRLLGRPCASKETHESHRA
ncbi:heavy metal translocating P-type ATPase metal-binding domain-containing protein [Halomonas aquamarina]|uniref:Heavy metal translocating P-type ATPase metal-binding domain-containing protein n=1 Tax=Vreelandella aquamarina TaxID=77097 RepID=A0ACC5VPA5_9GAMM|nr:heavy metal translocating P-type ATPase metal-binding domain-containing protein [Halomonas aquamarina]MBZ5486038.1 heavy metal translocating P-type ATPase metal-binding domain-containing protein [Halomonas aquamarina]